MKKILITLSNYKSCATYSEKNIIENILIDPEKVVELSVKELADKSFVSQATVVRLCKKIGFNGYKDFIRAIAIELINQKEVINEKSKQLKFDDDDEKMIEKITINNIISLQESMGLLNIEVLNEVIQKINNAKNIILFGMGASQCVTKDLYLKFLRINKMTIFNEDWHSQLLSAINSGKEDIGIFISYSGYTNELIECAKRMKKTGAKIILLTRFYQSPLVELADYKLFVSANESIFRNAAMSSRIALLNLVDIIYTKYANLNYQYSIERLIETHLDKGGEKGDDKKYD